MSDRMLEIFTTADKKPAIEAALADCTILEAWYHEALDERVVARVLLSSKAAESVIDELERRLAGTGPYRIVALPVEAVVPRAPEEEPPPEPAAKPKAGTSSRVSREELWADLSPSTHLSWTFLTTVVLSTVVAAIGLFRDNATLVIGAMLIAPLLKPNIALSLATTLGDLGLGKRALGLNCAGFLTAFLLSVAVGALAQPDFLAEELQSRTQLGVSDLALALAAGISGALAFTTGAPAALVGVMVAVALLPPLATTGMAFGAARWSEAMGAGLLVVANVICVNLAGVVTFLVQGVRPRTWWEADRAKRSARRALILWILLFAALVAVILLSKPTLETIS